LLFVIFRSISLCNNYLFCKASPNIHSCRSQHRCTICAALISLLIWPSVFNIEWHSVPVSAILTIIWLGIFPTGVAAIIFFVLIRRAGPTFLSNINYLIPLVAYFTGALVLGELVVWHDMVALVAILFGIAISRRPARNKLRTV